MPITKFIITEPVAQELGLQPGEMARLGRYVAIAGTNGAGKTRLLSALKRAMETHQSNVRQQLIEQRQSLVQVRDANPGSPQMEEWQQSIARFDQRIRDVTGVEWEGPAARAIDFVPKVLDLLDPASVARNELVMVSDRIGDADISTLGRNGPLYIQARQDQWREATHPNSTLTDEGYSAQYDSLSAMVRQLLNAELGRDVNGAATLFGRPLATASLSDGQKVLLQLAAALHAQGSRLQNAIILLDEPENHLHPGVLIDVLKALERAAPNAQLWIATHSVPLLAYIASRDPMAIWYVDAGAVSHAGRKPERVLEGLLGGEEGVSQLIAFAGLPSELAAVNFAVECLRDPGVAAHQQGDEQLAQIRAILGEGTKKVIDFGAGKGRLAAALAEAGSTDIDYVAVDPATEHQHSCKAAIALLHGADSARHFETIPSLLANKGEAWADVVVMTNVLHEIIPADWEQVLAGEQGLAEALRPDGALLVVEDHRMPVGELAHKHGFLVLDTAQLQKLFGVLPADLAAGKFVVADARRGGRLKAHWISRDLLKRVTPQTIEAALLDLREQALRTIEELRANASPAYAHGLAHALWTQQFANACLALHELGAPTYASNGVSPSPHQRAPDTSEVDVRATVTVSG